MARSWIEIDEQRLTENYHVVCEAAGADTEVLAVVKANAYGHGLERCAVALARAGARWLGVADAAEGIRVRHALEAAGIARNAVDILVMCGVMRDEGSAIVEHGLTPVVWTAEQVGWLREAKRQKQIQGSFASLRMTGEAGRRSLRVHVEVETGMGRQGVRPGAELEKLLREIVDAKLEVDGICTHFSSAEVAGSTREQKQRFEAAVEEVKSFPIPRGGMGHPIRWVHAGSSSSVDVDEDAVWLKGLAQSAGARAMVRSGIALYGYCLPAQGCESKIRAKLKPVMTWKTRVLDVRDVTAGETIGYNATYTAKKAMRVALLPVGYADGLRRELSGTDERAGGWVMARGADGAKRRAPIIGRVSMNLTTADVTGIDGVRVGDEVVLLGDGVTADDHARIAETISYEILCGVKR